MDTNVESSQPVEESSPSTEVVVSRLTSPSLRVRLDTIQRLGTELSEPELIIAGIFSTLFVYSDSKSLAAVESLLKKLLIANSSNTQVLKYFLAHLRKTTLASLKATSTSTYGPRITLLRWHCIFLESCLKTVAGEGPILSLVVSNQSSLLSSFVDISPRIRDHAFHRFVASLEQPDIYQLYIKQILEEEPSASHVILVGLLLSHTKTHPSKLAQHKAKFLDWYTKVTLASTTLPHVLAHELFVPLLNSLDNSDFTSSVIPALVRALKRSPEVAAWNTATMLRLITQKSFDAALHKDALLPVVYPLVLGSSEKLRSDGINVLHQILLHTKTGPGFVGLVTDITKQGPLQYPYQRSSVFLSLLHAAERLTVASEPIDVDANAVVAAILLLIPVIDKEGALLLMNFLSASEEARCLGLRALGVWMRFVSTLPEPAVKLFTAQLKSDKDPIRAATIEAIESAVSQKPTAVDSELASYELLKPDSDKAQQAIVFVEALAAVVKNAKGPKGADTSSPVAAARVLVKLAAANSAVDAKIDKTVWQAVLGAGGFYFQPSYLTRLNEKEVLSFLHLLESVLILAFARIKQADAAFFASHAWLLTHPLYSVRRATIQATKRLHPQLPKLADLLSTATIKLAHDLSGITAASASSNANANEKADPTSVPTPQVLGTMLSTAASPTLSDSLLPALFTATHLPYVDIHTWHHTSKSLGKVSGNILQKEEMAKAVVDRLMSHEVLLNKDSNLQVAGQRGLATAAQDSGDTTVSFAITQFRDLLSKNILAAISTKDVAIYKHPEGELYEKVETEYVPKLREDKKPAAASKEHRKRGERGLYSKADLAYEEKLRKDLEEKKKKEDAAAAAKPKFTEAELKVLAKESQTRANVAQVRANISNTLKGIRAIAVANQEICHGNLRTFIELLLPVVSHPLTSDLTFPVLEALGRCLQPPVQAYAHPVAHLILTIYEPRDPDAPQENSFLWELQKVLGVVQAHGKPLGASSFSFLFPIIKACLEKMYLFVIQEAALEVVEIHLSHGGNYPRGAMIASLAAVVAVTARLEPRAKAAIIALGSGLRTTDMALGCAAFVSPDANVRNAVLSAIDKTPSLSSFPEMEVLTSAVWAARYDSDPTNVAIAESIWKRYAHPLTAEASKYLELFLPRLGHKEAVVRRIYACAIAGAMSTHPGSIAAALDQMFSLYENLLPLDGEKENDTPENIQLRCGVAVTVGKAAEALQGESLANVFHWMIDASLGDSEEMVNQELVQSGMEVVNVQGSRNQGLMFPIFDKFLAQHDTGTRRQDQVRESVIVFMGVLAKHVVGDEERVKSILARLVEALKTPSELVQVAVSKCLTQLVPSIKPAAQQLVTRLLEILRAGKGGYALLRGTAYGLAGVVKGLGVISLKQHDVLPILGTAVEDKKVQGARQAAVLGYECLSNTLGRGFEPYVNQILPKLLICLGDSTNDVRTSAGAAAKKIMGQLSPHGVRLLLPILLRPVEDKGATWRTKEGSIELLGAMAFCAPKQLSTCLPTIVPRLVEVLMDTHEAVQKATKEALSHVGSVIRNPEVQIHVKKILRALYDPDNTKDALEALLNTNFVHSIDAPSLSLIMPLLDRGLRDRATDTKKRAAQIVGNMCSLTDPHELIPYLAVLIPNLKGIVTDPIPEVRTMAAVAMGSLVSGMGEDQFGTLIAWMLETIRSDLGSVERSGAAQGLSQILGALGPERLNSLFPDLVAGTHSSKYYVREGAMYMFSFLPTGMQRGFQTFLPKVMPCVLGGLADDSEIVREVAMRAGQTIVNEYYTSAVDVLIPCLEEGLFSDNWRIRQSSVSLLGDFMTKVTGGDVSDAGEEDSDRTARAKTDITKAMGEARVHSILAALYMIRFDVNTSVRQKTMLVWKSLVNNTPKTLREILPTLMSTLIACMGSTNLDRRQVAARTLGDLVSKLGERVLPEIIPMLERGLDSKDKDRRLGVCVGLAEVISAAGKQSLGGYLADVIPTVRIALQDRLPEVREAAAQAFDMLYTSVGPKVLDDVLPPLLASLSKERVVEGEPSPAGDALRQILLVRSQAVLPFLIPKLIARPLTPANAGALSSVASVAGAALNEHLSDILPVLLGEATNPSRSAEDVKEIKAATEKIILAVQDEGLDILIPELQQQIESDEPTTRAGAADLLAAFCGSTKADLEPFAHDLIVSLLGLFNDPEERVLLAAWNALGSVTKTIKKENLSFIEAVDEGIEQVSDELPDEDEKVLPGFCIAKGLQPILPLLLNGLMLGSPEQRELSAVVIGQAIKLTSSDALRPFVVQITGPLIRVIADRFPWQVKSAILSTLTLLIGKGAAAMKPFLPQLQTTFIKALHDPTALVRKNAALALGKLMALTVRIDPLLNELLAGVSATEGGVQEGMIGALRQVLEKAPANVDPAALLKVANAMTDLLEHSEENVRVAAAKTLTVYAKVAPAEQFDSFFNKNILEQEGATWQGRHGRSVAIFQLLKTQPDLATKHYKNLVNRLQQQTKDDKAGVKQYAAESLGCLLESSPAKSAELVGPLAQLINDTMQATSDVALAALRGTKRFAKAQPSVMSRHLASFIPLVVARLKDKVLPVKIEAERVLLHALQIFTNQEILKDYVASTDPVFSRYLTDYVTRVIKKLNPKSDAEEDEEDT